MYVHSLRGAYRTIFRVRTQEGQRPTLPEGQVYEAGEGSSLTIPAEPDSGPDEADIERLIQLGERYQRIVAFTGAGISTESGIPDYRGPGGVWETRKPPTIGDFLDNPETRRAYWQRRLHDYPTLAGRTPNSGHQALVELERRGRLAAIITQNIDGLHQKAGNRPDRVIELHGTAHEIRCVANDHRWSAAEIQTRLQAGEEEPMCATCGGLLRSATILFGEPLPPDAWARSVALAQSCDLMLVVGSSLVVQPAARLPELAMRRGAAVAIINRTETALDSWADLRIAADAGPVLSAFVAGLN
jgi:NAD-dependent deacetylase